MAHQLLSAGEEIGFLGLLDPIGLVISQSRADSGAESEKIPANNLLHSFVTGRLKLYRDEARGLSRYKRVRFIAEKIISLGQKLGDQKAIRGVQREMHQLAVFNASKLAGGRYRPKPLTGLKALEVFLSAHPRRTSLESFEWSRLWEGKTVLHHVPGKDSGDMLSGENARVLGALLRERLRTALSGKSVAGANRHEQMSEIALPQRTI
jgi:thioesterase domain-containing protein